MCNADAYPPEYGVNTLWTVDADHRRSAVADTSKCRVSTPGVVVQLSRVCRGNFSRGKIGQGMRVGSSKRTRKERLSMKRDSSCSKLICFFEGCGCARRFALWIQSGWIQPFSLRKSNPAGKVCSRGFQRRRRMPTPNPEARERARL